MKLFILSALLRKTEIGTVTMKLIQGYRGTETEEEAIGLFLSTQKKEFPGFDIAEYLVMEVPPEDLQRLEAAKQEQS